MPHSAAPGRLHPSRPRSRWASWRWNATESLVGTEEEPEDNGQPADQESLLPLNIPRAPREVTPDELDAAPEQADAASPGALEQLKSSVKASVKDVLVPGSVLVRQNDNEARSPEQAQESRGKMVCMTLVTVAK